MNKEKKKKEGEKNLSGMKNHYNGLSAAFITFSFYDMYIFASDCNPSITRGLLYHDGTNSEHGNPCLR